VIIIAAIGFMVASPAPASAQTLRSASITFHTNDDDKDNDTVVTISVQAGNYEVASLVNSGTRFPDQSDSGPFALNIHGNPSLDSLRHGKLHVHIAPNGHDHWKFNATLTFEFTDGTRLTPGWTGFDVNQDRPDQDASW
jgi:hypothetical protein